MSLLGIDVSIDESLDDELVDHPAMVHPKTTDSLTASLLALISDLSEGKNSSGKDAQ